MAMLSLGINSPMAVADDPNPGNTTIDNYALMDSSSSMKMGFQSSSTTNYLVGNSIFTVEMWIKPDSTALTSQYELFSKTDMLQYEMYNGVFRAIYHDGSGWKTAVNTGISARIDIWQHIAYVKNGTTFTLFVNGVQRYTVTDATNVPNSLNNATSYLNIASNPWNGSGNGSSPGSLFFGGGIDEVRVWTTARTAAELVAGMDVKVPLTSTGLASYWDFNGTTSNTTLYDRKGLLDLGIFGTPKPSFPDVKSSSTLNGYTILTFPRSYISGVGGWTVPAGVTSVDALVVGGGGGGAGNTSASYVSAGGAGGGGGAYLASALAVSDSVTVTVGTGGYGGAANSVTTGTFGGQGTTSAFGVITGGGGGGAGNDSGSSLARQNGLAGTAGGSGGGATNFLNSSTYGSAGAGNSVTFGGTTYSGQTGYAGGAYISGLGTAGPGGGTRGAANPSSTYAAGAGFTSSINGTSTTYGAGGGAYGISGWSFAATTTTPGRGGDGSYNNGTMVNGAPGGPGIVILKFVVPSTLSGPTFSTPIYKGVATNLSATGNSIGRVTFFANGKKIGNCVSIATAASAPFTATCSWKPTVRGYAKVSATFTPTVIAYGVVTTSANTFIATRTTRR